MEFHRLVSPCLVMKLDPSERTLFALVLGTRLNSGPPQLFVLGRHGRIGPGQIHMLAALGWCALSV